jgi:hypothetical protein
MKYLIILTTVFLVACSQTTEQKTKKSAASAQPKEQPKKEQKLSLPLEPYKIKPEEIMAMHAGKYKFFWREGKYADIVINHAQIKKMTVYERAALGYVATFVGNGCNYEGEFSIEEGATNYLKCDILSALDLGYQCSERHLGFLREMFQDDKKVLQSLREPCPEIVDGATYQTTFDKIDVEVIGKTVVVVTYTVSGVYLREGINWEFTVTDTFEVATNGIVLKKHVQSEQKETKFDI